MDPIPVLDQGGEGPPVRRDVRREIEGALEPLPQRVQEAILDIYDGAVEDSRRRHPARGTLRMERAKDVLRQFAFDLRDTPLEANWG
ncbi:MAG: hypothetical protein ACRDH8_13040 [Actinomycetota bacterium]